MPRIETDTIVHPQTDGSPNIYGCRPYKMEGDRLYVHMDRKLESGFLNSEASDAEGIALKEIAEIKDTKDDSLILEKHYKAGITEISVNPRMEEGVKRAFFGRVQSSLSDLGYLPDDVYDERCRVLHLSKKISINELNLATYDARKAASIHNPDNRSVLAKLHRMFHRD